MIAGVGEHLNLLPKGGPGMIDFLVVNYNINAIWPYGLCNDPVAIDDFPLVCSFDATNTEKSRFVSD